MATVDSVPRRSAPHEEGAAVSRRPRAAAIAVVVCTRDRAHRIGACVSSILASPLRTLELLVVDQSEGEETRAILSAFRDPRLRVLWTSPPGLARARNVGVEASSAPILLFTDDDCRVEPDWVERFLAEFERDPTLDGVYGRVLPDGPARPGWVCYSVMTSTTRRLVAGLPRGFLQESIGHGNAMAFRRECFVRHGLFHEWLGAGTPMTGGEDTDFAFRILRAGARLAYSPLPLAHHDNWMPIADSNRQLYGYARSASAVYTRFALRGVAAALALHLRTFGRSARIAAARAAARDAAGVAHAARLLRVQLEGIAWGVRRVAVRPPAYRAGARTRTWRDGLRADRANAV